MREDELLVIDRELASVLIYIKVII